MRKNPYLVAIGTLALVNIVIVWLLPVLPFQDLPQHLAYVRIFADYDRPDLRFAEFFRLPDHFEPYFTVYAIMARLAKWTSVNFALRVVISAYVVTMIAAFHVLFEAARRTERSTLRDPQWGALLACLSLWSPATVMGFLAFFLCIPLILVGAAGVVGQLGAHPVKRDRWLAIASAILLTSIHLAAAGFFFLLVVLLVLFSTSQTRRFRWRSLEPLGVLVVSFFAWSRFAKLGVGRVPDFKLDEAIHRTFGVDIVTVLFGLTWSDVPIVINQILWTVCGPYRAASIVFIGAVLVWAATRIFVRANAPDAPPVATPLAPAALTFAAICCFVPWGMKIPTELTFINLRMMSVALPLMLCAIDVRRFERKQAKQALLVVCAVVVAHFGVRAAQFGGEAAQAMRLIGQVEKNKILASLVFHDQSYYFGKQFRLTHFLPMYALVEGDVITSQFWGQYTDHLPIGWRPGKQPPHAPDWKPEQFRVDKLEGSDYLLAQWAADDNSMEVRGTSAKMQELFRKMQPVACEGLWCLYRLRR